MQATTEQVTSTSATNSTQEFVSNMADLSKEFQSIAARLQVVPDVVALLQRIVPELQSAAGKLNTLVRDIADLEVAGKQLQSVTSKAQLDMIAARVFKPRIKHGGCFAALENNYGLKDRNQLYVNIFVPLIHAAVRHGGVVYGGFVRDIVVPHRFANKMLSELDFKDIDLWFSEQEKADAFVAELKEYLIPVDIRGANGDCPAFYPTNRTQYMYTANKRELVLVDVVVNDLIPVNDFSVNCLTWNLTQFKAEPMFGQWNFGIDQLIADIQAKQAYISAFYVAKINKKTKIQQEQRFKELARDRCLKFKRAGYTISTHDNEVFVAADKKLQFLLTELDPKK
jgi:hypothetical protein